MRCETCDYLLFLHTGTNCPECGTPYETGRYTFPPGSVSFQCPHCGQAYSGNDERGLPDPRSFDCVQCGKPVTLEELLVVPEVEGASGTIGTPWDNRRHMGSGTALWESWRMLMARPSDFFRQMKPPAFSSGWLFAAILTVIAIIPTLMIQGIFFWIGTAAAPPGGGPAMGQVEIFLLVGMGVAMILIAPIIGPPITVALWGGAAHLALLVLAPKRRSFDYTAAACLYSMAAQALAVIPFCGGIIQMIWQPVIFIRGVMVCHRTSGLRATVAVLWPIVLISGLYLAVFALVLSTMASGGGGFGPYTLPGGYVPAGS